MIYEYRDTSLANLVTDDIETLMINEVALLGVMTERFIEELVTLKVYMDICICNIQEKDDIFERKLFSYKKKYSEVLGLSTSSNTVSTVFNIEIARG